MVDKLGFYIKRLDHQNPIVGVFQTLVNEQFPLSQIGQLGLDVFKFMLAL